jgi:hypothetical protein
MLTIKDKEGLYNLSCIFFIEYCNIKARPASFCRLCHSIYALKGRLKPQFIYRQLLPEDFFYSTQFLYTGHLLEYSIECIIEAF